MTTKPPPKTVKATTPTSGYEEKLLQDPLKGKGTISSRFGPRKAPTPGASEYHKGIDIKAATGTPVYASASGTVTEAGRAGALGLSIRIRHDGNTESRYSHLSEILVSDGAKVARGQIIGKVGSTGRTTGPHLHYEVFENGKQVNPSGNNVSVDLNDRSGDERAAEDNAKATGKKKTLNPEYVGKVNDLIYDQDEIIRQLLTGEHFQDNKANDFYNLTYNWKLFVTADTEVATKEAVNAQSTFDGFYEELAKYEQIIIAESGVTGFNIDSVTMEATVGTDFQTASNAFTNIEMTITEPNGAVFLDALRNSCLELGVQNYQKHFYYLELTFKGYNEDGSVQLSPFDDMPNGGRWLWTVIITDIQVGMSAGGGTYTLKLTPMSDSLLVNRYNTVPSTREISGSTVGEYMDALVEMLNSYYLRMKVGKDIITYDVEFHDVKDVMSAEEVRNMTIVPVEPEKNEERSLTFKEGSGGKTATVGRGYTISDVLDYLMMSCETAQKLAIDLVDKTIDQQKESTTGHRQSILWRVEPEVHHNGYDPLFNEYCKQITIHVYGFRNHAVVVSSVDEKQKSEEVQKAILADLAYRDFLPKKYEYLFTGNNSEVIDIDLNFNLNWSAELPRLTGATQEQAATHAKAQDEATLASQKPSFERKEPQFSIVPPDLYKGATASSEIAETIPPTDRTLIGPYAQQIAADREAAEERVRELERQAERGEDVAAELQKAREELAFRQKVFVENVQVAVDERARRRAEQPFVAPSRHYEREYGEELTSQKKDFESEVKYRKSFPITLRPLDPENTSGFTGQWHSGKSVYGSVLNQAYGPMATQFFQIEMTVRGDPFWIGAGSFEKLVLQKSAAFDGDIPNYSEGCNTFLFKMLYPLGQDDDGNILLNTNETVTGIYQINRITHKFENGKFTQVLKAIRVPLIDLYRSLYKKLYPTHVTSTAEEKKPE